MADDDACPDCGEYLDECQCEEEGSTLDDLHDLADLANKSADAYNKWKNILNPSPPKVSSRNENHSSQKPASPEIDDELQSKKRHKTAVILGLISIGIGIGGYVIAFIL